MAFLHGRLKAGGGKVAFGVKHLTKEKTFRTFYADPCRLPAEIFTRSNQWHRWITVAAFNGKRCEENASAIPALWAEIDPPASMDAGELKQWQGLTWDRMKFVDPEPSIIVFSGRGFHLYWVLLPPLSLTEENRPLVKQCNKKLAEKIGGDHCHDLARFLRLPGSTNPKNGVTCEIWKEHGPGHLFAELVTFLGAEALPQASDSKRKTFASVCLQEPEPAKPRGRGRPSYGVTLRDLRSLPAWARDLVVNGGGKFARRYRRQGGQVIGLDRSRADLAAIGQMIKAKWTDAKIQAAFSRLDWGIGVKYRELLTRQGPRQAAHYLGRAIGKAREGV